ncbi:MAG: ATP-binding protein [Ignisphaera sp.]|nr:ATP-binding protein [Ignisphaera sp.]MCX8167972.1 ATP-binding protein [Ignisphaera sp.]MDW8085569.1 ATP-binding protein [Ignisphaera sp.]
MVYRAVAIFSGGKDSTYALHLAVLQNFKIVLLLTFSPELSHPWYLHRPFVEHTHIQAKLMGFKHVFVKINAKDRLEEERGVRKALETLADNHEFDYMILGIVGSDSQRMLFLDIAEELGVKLYTPLWGKDRRSYLVELIRNGIEFVITSITSWGIPMDILGRVVTEQDAQVILRRAMVYGFDPVFEGGEAESFVVYAPLFRGRICIDGRKHILSDYEGYIVAENVYEC